MLEAQFGLLQARETPQWGPNPFSRLLAGWGVQQGMMLLQAIAITLLSQWWSHVVSSLLCLVLLSPIAFSVGLPYAPKHSPSICAFDWIYSYKGLPFFFFFFNWIQNFMLLSQFPQKISSRAPFIWCVCISSNIMQLSKSNVQTLYSLKSWVTMLMGPWSWWGILKRQLTHWQPLVSTRPVITLHTFLGIIYLVY